MIALTGIPAVVLDSEVSPELLSYLVATDAPVVFAFERRDGTIDSAVDQGGITRITLDAGHELVNGDEIGIYDAGLDEMVTGTATLVSTNVFDTDIDWVARYAVDLEYVLTYTQKPYYYVEVRIKLNNVYLSDTLRATTDQKGDAEIDISPFLRSAVSAEKVGDYILDSAAETYQSGEFEIEFRERHTGDSNSWTEEGNTWYYVSVIRSKEQGVNLHEYIAHGATEGEFFNDFETPVWTVGMPLDIQFWWPPWYNDLTAIIKQYSAANVLLDSSTISLDNSSKGKLCSVKINLDTIEAYANYLSIEVYEP